MTVLGFIFVVAVLVLIIAHLTISRSGKAAPRTPDCTMQEAWDYYVKNGPPTVREGCPDYQTYSDKVRPQRHRKVKRRPV